MNDNLMSSKVLNSMAAKQAPRYSDDTLKMLEDELEIRNEERTKILNNVKSAYKGGESLSGRENLDAAIIAGLKDLSKIKAPSRGAKLLESMGLRTSDATLAKKMVEDYKAAERAKDAQAKDPPVKDVQAKEPPVKDAQAPAKESKAASKIQSAYRGIKIRKYLTKTKGGVLKNTSNCTPFANAQTAQNAKKTGRSME